LSERLGGADAVTAEQFVGFGTDNKRGHATHKAFPFFLFAAAFAKFCFTLCFTILSIKT
jgi:hypothetical protein